MTAGVGVYACPPGKTILYKFTIRRRKALTSISLVFALFSLNPAPFCMLDEIDAPLDDANIDRFCQVLKEMSNNTQFIVITHKKPTMEYVDNLIGVTMGEKGVSKIVDVNLASNGIRIYICAIYYFFSNSFFVIIYTYNTYDYRISNKDYSKVKSIKIKFFQREKNNQKNVSISFNTHKKSRKLISNNKKRVLLPPQFKINFNQDEKDIIYIFSKANEKYTIKELEKFFHKNNYFINSMGVRKLILVILKKAECILLQT